MCVVFILAINWDNFEGFSANVTIIEKPEEKHTSNNISNHTDHHPDDHIPDGRGYNPIGGILVMVSIVLLAVGVFVVNKYKMRCFTRRRRRQGSDHFALVNEMET